MLKKRLIGVVTVKDGWAVQSIGYNQYLPLGKPECLVENLDRWGADEILLQIIDRTINRQGPDFKLLERVAKLGIQTPLIYGGGICTVQDGIQVIQSGADRLSLDAVLHHDLMKVHELVEHLGAQAIIAALPLSWNGSRIEHLNYCQKRSDLISTQLLNFLTKDLVSEALVIDWIHEGRREKFQHALLEHFPILNMPLIAFGGISNLRQIKEILNMKNVSAIAIGNFLNYREHAIQEIKMMLAEENIRLPIFEKDNHV